MKLSLKTLKTFILEAQKDVKSLSKLDLRKGFIKWHEILSQVMDKDIEHRDDAQVIHDFKNGYKIVGLQQCDLDAEGNAMGHCIGRYGLSQGKKIYSLRDARNKPHVTIEIEDNKVGQIKGKQNEPPNEKYAKMIRDWLKATSFDYESSDYVSIAIPEELALLAKSGDKSIHLAVAYNKNAPQDALRILTKNEYWLVRAAVARNENTPKDVLRTLAKDESSYVRSSVAENENASQDILRTLAKTGNDYVRIFISKNENTPKDILRTLAKDEYWPIRAGIAGNKNTSQDILKVLSNDIDIMVRLSATRNENTPKDVLRTLAKDENLRVRAAAIKNKNIT